MKKFILVILLSVVLTGLFTIELTEKQVDKIMRFYEPIIEYHETNSKFNIMKVKLRSSMSDPGFYTESMPKCTPDLKFYLNFGISDNKSQWITITQKELYDVVIDYNSKLIESQK